ncbi:MAG: alpha/beta hydrolase [Bacilli bacterium]|nr:alpha/beta hydrolase [Bacilli bacterium]
MIIKFKDIDVNYIQYGEGKDIILLHGWGQNIQMMNPLGDPLSKKYRVTILDFPGFGESGEPKEAWSIYDYALLVEFIIQQLNIKKPIIMGHSFGGRVAIKYSADHPIEKLILFGSPCIRRNQTFSVKVRILKSLKKLPGMDILGEKMKKYIGSRDYKAASPIMRQILVNTVNEDLSNEARRIEEPTLLVWGDHDTEAPLADAQDLENIMIDAGLVVLPGTHYAYLENLGRILNIVGSFIEGGN